MQATATTTSARPVTTMGEVGPWQLVRLVGEGKLCRVYQARPTGNSQARSAGYALKVLRSEWQHDPAAIDVLRREAMVGREVSHPRVVPVLAAHVGEAPQFVVMPFLPGAPLAHWLSKGRLFTWPLSLWIARQVAEALQELHRLGWMHADVKPSNIMLSSAGYATLIDLGFARRPGEEQSIVDRCAVGTARYIAPEMITSALRHDIRSDIYSLGATLYELLTRRPPWSGGSLAEVAAEHRQGEPPKLKALVPDLPAGVASLVHRMLANEPLRRPQTPAEVVEELARLEIETFASR
jgi:eukaryotic-like serine/threonine-protein kinase